MINLDSIQCDKKWGLYEIALVGKKMIENGKTQYFINLMSRWQGQKAFVALDGEFRAEQMITPGMNVLFLVNNMSEECSVVSWAFEHGFGARQGWELSGEMIADEIINDPRGIPELQILGHDAADGAIKSLLEQGIEQVAQCGYYSDQRKIIKRIGEGIEFILIEYKFKGRKIIRF